MQIIAGPCALLNKVKLFLSTHGKSTVGKQGCEACIVKFSFDLGLDLATSLWVFLALANEAVNLLSICGAPRRMDKRGLGTQVEGDLGIR